ncbi:MAG: hypothetical protein NC324_04550 [Bacteroides sp.]|nr:hypothetical protein [Bacteroides sp.]
MKRLFHLLAAILAFAASGLAQTKTDTIRVEVKPEENTELYYYFSEEVLPSVEIEWSLDSGAGKFRPADSGWTGVHHNIEKAYGWIYIYYTHEPQDSYDFVLVPNRSSAFNSYDIQVISEYSPSLDVSGCTALTSLSCDNNQLTSLDVSGCTSLTSLYCYDNEPMSLDVSGCTQLKTLAGNRTETNYNYVEHYLTVDTLKIHGASMDTLVIGKYSKIKVIDAAGCTSIKNLSCPETGLTSLDVSGCTALTSLDCSSNDLTALDVSKNTALTSLDCSSNDLTALDVSKNTALTSLDCSSNGLTALDVSKNTALTSLDCRSNDLTALDVSKNTALTSLDCGGNAWTEWTVVSESLKTLYCSYNKSLTKLDVSGCTALTSLSCGGNAWTEWTVVSESLKTLSCFYNKNLTKLDVSGCTALTSLDCSDNKLTSLDVSKNTSLIRLSCDGNRIPLSVLYEAYMQRSYWDGFYSVPQSDSIMLLIDQPLDLSSERIIGQVISTYELADVNGKDVDAGFWEENRFEFKFHEPLKYTLKLQNPNIKQYGNPVTFTWHISVVEEMPVQYYTVKVSSNNTVWGTVKLTGNGRYEEGTEATVTATSKDGYRFVNWTKKDGTVFSTEATHTFKVTENLELTANFEKRPDDVETFTVTLSANNNEWGRVSISGDGTYEKDESVTITATPNEGYRFVNWTEKDGSVFSTKAVHTFEVTEDMELTANFEKDQNNVGNESREEDGFRVYAQDRVIHLSEYREVQVYNTVGQCLYNGHATAIPVRQSGLYIVKAGNKSHKVIVR